MIKSQQKLQSKPRDGAGRLCVPVSPAPIPGFGLRDGWGASAAPPAQPTGTSQPVPSPRARKIRFQLFPNPTCIFWCPDHSREYRLVLLRCRILPSHVFPPLLPSFLLISNFCFVPFNYAGWGQERGGGGCCQPDELLSRRTRSKAGSSRLVLNLGSVFGRKTLCFVVFPWMVVGMPRVGRRRLEPKRAS